MEAGEEVVGSDQLYGRSLKLLGETLPALGIGTRLVDVSDAGHVAAALTPKTRAVLIETVSGELAD